MAYFEGTENSDTIYPGYVSSGVYMYPSGVYPSDAADQIYGSGGNDYLSGGGGGDEIYTGWGYDEVYGGLGDDYILVNDYYDNYEYNYLYGEAGNDTIVGNETEDYMYGQVGGDWLQGNGGYDYLDGGAGADQMFGGSGDDTYVVDSSGDYVEDVASNGGYDSVQASISYTLSSLIESLYLIGSAAINGTGNEVGNYIAGNEATNTLTGLGGIDTLEGYGGSDSLDGGTGADWMNGGTGDDFYYVGSTSDTVVEYDTGTYGGSDTVYATTGFTLGTNVETLALVGTTAANGTGNAGLNNLYGNSLANTLRGLGGADTFRSGNGADVLIGGTGNDLFQYLTATGSTPASRDIIRAGDTATAFQGAGSALGDRFDLSLVDANTQTSGVQDFVFGTAMGRGRLWAATSGSNTLIRGNTDSDTAAEFEVTIEDGTVLASAYTTADFLL